MAASYIPPWVSHVLMQQDKRIVALPRQQAKIQRANKVFQTHKVLGLSYEVIGPRCVTLLHRALIGRPAQHNNWNQFNPHHTQPVKEIEPRPPPQVVVQQNNGRGWKLVPLMRLKMRDGRLNAVHAKIQKRSLRYKNRLLDHKSIIAAVIEVQQRQHRTMRNRSHNY